MHLASKENKDPKNASQQNVLSLSMKKDGSFSNRSIDLSSDLSSVSSFTVYSNQDWVNSDNKKMVTEKLSYRLQDVLQALRNFDKERNGKVLPSNLHNVLNIFCQPLTLQEFNELVKKEKLDENGYISYKSFLTRLTNKKKELESTWLDKDNKIILSDSNTEEIEVKMKQKISKNLKNFIRSMWLYDYNQDGLIQKQEFRTVLENYGFPLNDDQFNRFAVRVSHKNACKRLWSLYDPNRRGVLNYKDFLLKLGARSELYKRVMPRDSRSKVNHTSPLYDTRQEQVEKRCAKLGRDDPEVQGQVISNVIEVFRRRVEKNFPILLRTFQIKYGCEDGLIPMSVFHQVLNYFVMPTSIQLFKQVLMRFNISPTANKIQWYEFLKSVCVNKDTKCQADTSHLSRSHSWSVCKSIVDKLRKNGKNSENFFKLSFTMVDQNNKMTITRAELRRTLNLFLVLPLSEEEFRSLMFVLDPGHTNVIDCQNFLSLFNSSSTEKSEKTSEELSCKGLGSETTSQLTGEKLKIEFKKSFNKNFKNIEKAINAFDSEESGFMHINDLRKILQSFCFHLSDAQSREIFSNFTTTSNKIFYSDFFNHFKKSPYEDEEKWSHCVKKLTTTQNVSKKVEKEDILRYIREAVVAHGESFLQEFKTHDYCNAGIAKKETLSKLLNKYVFRFTEEQFNMLWNLLPVNEIGFLKYEDFLEDFSKHRGITSNEEKMFAPTFHRSSSFVSQSSKKSFHSASSASRNERPKTASSVVTARSLHSSKSSYRPKSAASKCSWERQQSVFENEAGDKESVTHFLVQGQGCSVLTNQQYKQFRSMNFKNTKAPSKPNSGCKMTKEANNSHENYGTNSKCSAYEKNVFVNSVKSRWRDILRRCKVHDPENSNIITWDAFQSILHKTGISINDEVQNLLDTEFNIKKESPVNYWIFLKKLLLALDSTAFNINKIDHSTKMGSHQDSVGLCKVLLTNRDKILKNYRDLRHAFRRGDQRRCGSIKASEFRKVLALHKIYLSEDDFFYICDHFDPKLTERIAYDEFLGAFVQNRNIV